MLKNVTFFHNITIYLEKKTYLCSRKAAKLLAHGHITPHSDHGFTAAGQPVMVKI